MADLTLRYAGTKTGLLLRSEVLSDFKKIVRGQTPERSFNEAASRLAGAPASTSRKPFVSRYEETFMPRSAQRGPVLESYVLDG